MTPQEMLEGEVQLLLVDAWSSLQEAVAVMEGVTFGRGPLRLELLAWVRALRGCVLLAAGRLIDVRHLEEGILAQFAESRVRTKTGQVMTMAVSAEPVRECVLLCPVAFPAASLGLGAVGPWVAKGEVVLRPFLGVGPGPRSGASADRLRVRTRKAKVSEALARSDKMLEEAALAMRRRAGVEE